MHPAKTASTGQMRSSGARQRIIVTLVRAVYSASGTFLPGWHSARQLMPQADPLTLLPPSPLAER
jgi:hypothetical protein